MTRCTSDQNGTRELLPFRPAHEMQLFCSIRNHRFSARLITSHINFLEISLPLLKRTFNFIKLVAATILKWERFRNCFYCSLIVGALPFLRWCYTRRFAKRIFSATQRCNVVATVFRIVTTMFQLCNAVLRDKSIVVANRPV